MLVALLTSALAGPFDTALVEAGVGVSGVERPLGPALSWHAGLHWAFGSWLSADRLTGRYHALGVLLRQDVAWADGAAHVRTAPMLTYRRGLHLLVAGAHVTASAGPLFASDTVLPHHLAGGTVRLGLGASWRAAIPWMVALRFEAGADVTDQVTPVLGLSIGFEHLAQR